MIKVIAKKGKINVITMGCSKNLVDSEVLVKQLQMNNLEVVHNDEGNKYDAVVINTCGFIEASKQESIDMILDCVEAKKRGEIKQIYVMGCLSERYMQALKNDIPEVDQYFGANNLEEIVKELGSIYRKELVGERSLSTPKHFAYLKISEGCDRTCSFCAIPLMRGKHQSKRLEEIVLEANLLAKQGVKELILIAQDLTYYGIDLYKERKLKELLLALETVEGIEWIRLHYLYPAQFPFEILEVMANSSKICKYIDIPLQHGSSKVLKDMNRKIDRDKTELLVSKMREIIPTIAIRTSLIVGFPTEGEPEFEEMIDFVQKMKFDRSGVFTYSHEEDTSAYQFEDIHTDQVKQERAEQLMQLQESISLNRNQSFIGKKLQIIIDREEEDYYVGRTEYDSPEIDNEVLVEKTQPLKVGHFYLCHINDASEFDLLATPE